MYKLIIIILAVGMLLSLPAHAASLTVPGTSNPWLAGLPDGTTATGCCDPSCGLDIVPEESPILFTPVVPGSFLSFEVTGSVSNDSFPSGLTPDGGLGLISHNPENGIAGFTGVFNSLIGVFLDNSQPNLSPAPEDFPYLPNASTFAPGLKQVFFIGDGLTGTGSGAIQQFLVPAGATRLFLGALDGCGWHNNFGEFVTTVTTTTASDDSDGDGVLDDEDECPNSDLSATVIIDGCNAGVSNTLFPSGCTISDLIAACAEGARNHGKFVSCVSHFTKDLKKPGVITVHQKGALQRCAAHADIP